MVSIVAALGGCLLFELFHKEQDSPEKQQTRSGARKMLRLFMNDSEEQGMRAGGGPGLGVQEYTPGEDYRPANPKEIVRPGAGPVNRGRNVLTGEPAPPKHHRKSMGKWLKKMGAGKCFLLGLWIFISAFGKFST